MALTQRRWFVVHDLHALLHHALDATATTIERTEIRCPEDLPDDPVILKRLVFQLLSTLHTAKREKAQLAERLQYLLRRRYGPQSERSDPAQLALFTKQIMELLGHEQAAPERSSAEGSQAKPQDKRSANGVGKAQRSGGGRRRLPEHLPRVDQIHELSEAQRACPGCGTLRDEMGTKVSEELEMIPAQLIVIRHVRKTYACPSCESQVVTAPRPTGPIPKGLAGPGLLAQVILSKFDDHLPTYRQEEILKRNGFDLSRSTMCDWLVGAATTLEPLVKLMRQRVRKSRVIQTDGTSLPLVERGRGAAQSTGCWVYRGDDLHPYVVYDWAPNQSRSAPEAWLRGFSGVLQADASTIYDPFFDEKKFGTKLWEAGCWAHSRRYFDKAKQDQPAEAMTAIAWIAELYAVEDRVKGMSPRRRRKIRRRDSRRILRGFERWLKATRTHVLPKSPVSEGIEYVLRHWTALTCYVDHGRVSIDNNDSERAIRPLKIGAKNWLFMGSTAGARATAILFSVVESAKRCGANPWSWLSHVLGTINDLPQGQLAELLPDAWARNQRRPVPQPK